MGRLLSWGLARGRLWSPGRRIMCAKRSVPRQDGPGGAFTVAPARPGRKEMELMLFKARALLLSLVALLVMGAIAAGSAYAEAGPFFYGREVGSKGGGQKLSGTKLTEVQGEITEQVLQSTIGGTSIEIV